jgi:1,4-alpha-glucan branching enzyme
MSGGAVEQAQSIDRPTKTATTNPTNTVVALKQLAAAKNERVEDGTGVIRSDPWLQPFVDALKYRYSYYLKWMSQIEETSGGLDQFSRGYEYFGMNHSSKDGGLYYREWAPNAQQAFFIGDFSKFV